MKVGIPKERYPGEKRVAVTPEQVTHLQTLGYEVAIEAGAGERASFDDEQYWQNDVEIVCDRKQLWSHANIILKVRVPSADELNYLSPGQVLICLFWPTPAPSILDKLRAKNITILAIDKLPDLPHCEKMDAFKSMSTLCGYRAVVEAAYHVEHQFSGEINIMGENKPIKVLILGTNSAALSAIDTAKKLGADIYVFDSQASAKKQVEDMGVEFLYIDSEIDGKPIEPAEVIAAENALLTEQVTSVDIIIASAFSHNQPARILVTSEMISGMKKGSVIVDLAIEYGGNCELSSLGEIVETDNGIKVIACDDLASRIAIQASEIYATNLCHFLSHLTPDGNGQLVINEQDEIVLPTLATD